MSKNKTGATLAVNKSIYDVIREKLRAQEISDGDVMVLGGTNGSDGPVGLYAVQVGSKGLELLENIEDRLFGTLNSIGAAGGMGELIHGPDMMDEQPGADTDPKGRTVYVAVAVFESLGKVAPSNRQIEIAQATAGAADTPEGQAMRDTVDPEKSMALMRERVKDARADLKEATKIVTESRAMMTMIGKPNDPGLEGIVSKIEARSDRLRNIITMMNALLKMMEDEGITIKVMQGSLKIFEAVDKLDDDIADIITTKDECGCPACRKRAAAESSKDEDEYSHLPEGVAERLKQMDACVKLMRVTHDEVIAKAKKLAGYMLEIRDAVAVSIGDDPSELTVDDVLRWIKESANIREQFKKVVAQMTGPLNAGDTNGQ